MPWRAPCEVQMVGRYPTLAREDSQRRGGLPDLSREVRSRFPRCAFGPSARCLVAPRPRHVPCRSKSFTGRCLGEGYPGGLAFPHFRCPEGPSRQGNAAPTVDGQDVEHLDAGQLAGGLLEQACRVDTKTVCFLRTAAARIPFISRSLVDDYLCGDLVALHNLSLIHI